MATKTKTIGWLVLAVLMVLGGAVGFVTYRTLDTRYRCHLATEVFGLVFSLAVIALALRQPQQLLALALIATASAMFVFHAAYFVEKNVLGRRE